MAITTQKLCKTFETIRGNLQSSMSGQGEEADTVHSALQELADQMPKRRAQLRNLLVAMASAMDIRRWSNGAIPAEVLKLVDDSIVLASQSVSQKNKEITTQMIDEAAGRLQLAVDQAQSSDVSTAAVQVNDQIQVGLNDVAAMLVMFEPEVSDDVAKTRSALSQVIDSGLYTGIVKDLLLQALLRLDNLLSGNFSNARDVWAEVGRLVETSLNAAELSSGPPQSKAEPEPESEPESKEEPAVVPPNKVQSIVDSESAVCLPADVDKELLSEFIVESIEYAEGAEAALLELETHPEESEAINTVFRAFHTVKGTSAYIGLKYVTELAHLAESLLSRVRDKEISCTGGYADLSLRSVDMLRRLLGIIQRATAGQSLDKPDGYDELMHLLKDPEGAGISSSPTETFEQPRLGDILVAQGAAEREAVEAVAANQGKEPIGIALVKDEVATLTEVAHALRTQQKIAGSEQAVESSVRVRTDRLDRLIDMVGELVIAQSMVAQDDVVIQGHQHELARKVTHAGKIVRELQDLSMSLRMVPLKATFQKMNRLIRDLAQKQGKAVTLITEDRDTEIDRNMVDAINDILVHMARNAVDHGIEFTDERERTGKPKEGMIRLAAYHSGGSVVVDISDDGRGLNRDKIVAKAIKQGLIESGKSLSDSEIYNLIFEPGFSTAEQVTDVSGRGVGMDVVRRQIESLRGRVEITSELGKGSTFSVRLPLTLAITDGMLVRVGTERYIIPTVNIHLSFRPEANAISSVTGRGEMVMLRGELMPIFRLHRLFGAKSAVEEVTNGLLVVVGDGERRCALLVDMLLGKQQVVAKSLGAGINKSTGISGAAILGDGRVGLILDPSDLVAVARQNSRSETSRPAA